MKKHLRVGNLPVCAQEAGGDVFRSYFIVCASGKSQLKLIFLF